MPHPSAQLASTVTGEDSAAKTVLIDPTMQGTIVRTTTPTETIDLGEAADTVEMAQATDPAPTKRRRPRRRTVVIASVAVLVVAAIAGTLIWNHSLDTQLVQAQQDADRALTNLDDATRLATTSITAAGTALALESGLGLADSAANIDTALASDEASALVEDLTTAQDLQDQATDDEPSWSDRLARTRELKDLTEDADQATAALTEATASLEAAVAAWQLTQASTAYDTSVAALDETLTGAQTRLAETEGQVLEDSSRVALSSAIDQATAVRAAEVDRNDADALNQAASQVNAQRDALASAVSAVDQAVTAWQAEQDRLAAEQSAAAATTSSSSTTGTTSKSSSSSSSAGSSTSRSGTSNSSGTSSSSNGGSASSGSGGSTSNSGSGSDGSYWVESESGFGSDLCGDTSGNSWEC